MRVGSENGWITCQTRDKTSSWGQKDHKKYFLVFSAFPVRQYTKWSMLSALTLGTVEESDKDSKRTYC